MRDSVYRRTARAELPEPLLRRLAASADDAGTSPYYLARLLLARYLGHRTGLRDWHRLVASPVAMSEADEDPGFLDSPEGRPVLLLAGFAPTFWALLDRELAEYGLSAGEWATAVIFRYFSDRDAPRLHRDLQQAFGLQGPGPDGTLLDAIY